MSDTELVHLVAYEDDSELDVEFDEDGDPVVQNHDEVEKYDEVRCLDAETAHEYNMDIVTPQDHLWRDEFADLERGDAIRV